MGSHVCCRVAGREQSFAKQNKAMDLVQGKRLRWSMATGSRHAGQGTGVRFTSAEAPSWGRTPAGVCVSERLVLKRRGRVIGGLILGPLVFRSSAFLADESPPGSRGLVLNLRRAQRDRSVLSAPAGLTGPVREGSHGESHVLSLPEEIVRDEWAVSGGGVRVTEEAQIQAEELGRGTEALGCRGGGVTWAGVLLHRPSMTETLPRQRLGPLRGFDPQRRGREAVALMRCQPRVPSEQALSLRAP